MRKATCARQDNATSRTRDGDTAIPFADVFPLNLADNTGTGWDINYIVNTTFKIDKKIHTKPVHAPALTRKDDTPSYR